MGMHRATLETLPLFLTVEHPCSYLPKRSARNLVADPKAMNKDIYSQLAGLGFRRSGDNVYRPHCLNCTQCLSLRIPVSSFQPNRSQQRTWNKNQDLHVQRVKPQFRTAHYALFKRYLKARHQGSGMDDSSPSEYLAFLTAHWSETLLYEFRLAQRLLAVAAVDRLDDGLSAVYTFFDPDESARSLGTFAILWQINEGRRQGLDWVYLGYWIRECEKMAYKTNFQPHEVFVAGRWISVP